MTSKSRWHCGCVVVGLGACCLASCNPPREDYSWFFQVKHAYSLRVDQAEQRGSPGLGLLTEDVEEVYQTCEALAAAYNVQVALYRGTLPVALPHWLDSSLCRPIPEDRPKLVEEVPKRVEEVQQVRHTGASSSRVAPPRVILAPSDIPQYDIQRHLTSGGWEAVFDAAPRIGPGLVALGKVNLAFLEAHNEIVFGGESVEDQVKYAEELAIEAYSRGEESWGDILIVVAADIEQSREPLTLTPVRTSWLIEYARLTEKSKSEELR